MYRVQLDNNSPSPDPTSLAQPGGVHGPSQALCLSSFAWSANDWNNIPLEDYIIYELHTGTFTEEGTFSGLEKKLGHLKDLGITAIEIMPVAQFPGSRNWGYDGVFPFAVQNSYGGATGLQKLVNACHQKGIAVILDVVYNHMGPEGNYLYGYGTYFTDKYKTPWGPAVNFDDAWCDGVRRFFIENALMWFRDFRVDALRLDAVHAIKDFSPRHLLAEIKHYVNAWMKASGKIHYLLVESDLNDTRFINPLEEGGYGMDAQWNDEFHHALRVTAGEEKQGYYSDFNGVADLAKSYRDAYVYDGRFSPHRHKFFGVKTNGKQGKQFIVFSQNHDQVGNRMLGERPGQLVSFEMQKLMAAAVITSPFLPLLFMGEEWGETNPFLYFVSHTDTELCEAVKKGRQAEFACFHHSGEAPDPVAEETFLSSRLQWNLKDAGRHKAMFEFYKTLISLRKDHPALKNLDRENLYVTANEENNTLVLERWHQQSEIACLMNFSTASQKIAMEKKDWTLLLNSADAKWFGPGDVILSEQIFELHPESVILLSKR